MTLPDKAISVRQPWAWAIIHGGKDVENRNKAPFGSRHLIGSRIAIHAAKGMTRDEYEGARDFMATLGVKCPHPSELVRGAVIGSARLTDIVSERPSRWFFGPRGLVLADAEPCDPIGSVGQLGWFLWRSDGEVDPPKPWMLSWPDRPRRKRTVKTAELFPPEDQQGEA